jgi:putative transposase
VDNEGNTVDFLLTARRDRAAAQRFLARAIEGNGLPQTVTIDQSGANTAGIESYNAEHDTAIAIRQCKYLNNIVEQDHRAVKRIIRPMLGFKSFVYGNVTRAFETPRERSFRRSPATFVDVQLRAVQNS